MMITRNNLNEVLFENQDARLLTEYLVAYTQVTLYYYHGVELTLEYALKVYNRIIRAEKDSNTPYTKTYNKSITKKVLYS